MRSLNKRFVFTKRFSLFVRITRSFFFTVTLFFVCLSPAFSQVYEISPDTSHVLEKAIDRLKPGDTLRLADGAYSVSAMLRVSGVESHPITIEGSGKTFLNGSKIDKYAPVFRTNGQSYLIFKQLNFKGVRAGVQIDEGSTFVSIDGLRADGCQFAVKMKDASYVTIQNSYADNSRNAFRGEGESHHVTFENVEAYRSKDIYEKMNKEYLNGDGFIFEDATHDLVFRNIKTGEHWDAGLDSKGSNVKIENVESFGNKNDLKLWGENIEVSNALIRAAKSQVHDDGSKADGWGINVRRGSTKVTGVTFSGNEAGDYKAKEKEGTIEVVPGEGYRPQAPNR